MCTELTSSHLLAVNFGGLGSRSVYGSLGLVHLALVYDPATMASASIENGIAEVLELQHKIWLPFRMIEQDNGRVRKFQSIY